MYHRTNSLGALNMKAGEKLVSTILAASTAFQESRLGTTSGRGYYSRMFESMALERRVLHLDSPPRGCINKGVLDFLSEDKTMYCTKLLLERAVHCQEQDRETIRRADQAHRARLIVRSIISFGCFSLMKSVFVFVYCFFE